MASNKNIKRELADLLLKRFWCVLTELSIILLGQNTIHTRLLALQLGLPLPYTIASAECLVTGTYIDIYGTKHVLTCED